MKSLSCFLSHPEPCEYLAQETWQLEYEEFEELSSIEYVSRLLLGWRRFGHTLFRPQCPNCSACMSLRIPVAEFCSTRSQRRIEKKLLQVIRHEIGTPSLNKEKLDLYIRYHEFQEIHKMWTSRDRGDPLQYFANFVHNPFATQEWRYFMGDRLVGIGYVDRFADGLSAIYFFYDPECKNYSLGTWNVLSLINAAKEQNLPYVYLGYYVANSPSMAYKARFFPHELLVHGTTWEKQDSHRKE